jgi:hypothetical protein
VELMGCKSGHTRTSKAEIDIEGDGPPAVPCTIPPDENRVWIYANAPRLLQNVEISSVLLERQTVAAGGSCYAQP